MRCDGSPDPTIAGEINTYMNLWRENIKDNDIGTILKESNLVLAVCTHLFTEACLIFCTDCTLGCITNGVCLSFLFLITALVNEDLANVLKHHYHEYNISHNQRCHFLYLIFCLLHAFFCYK